jgi:hypothetical protein|tara:strand:+ start:642 stop:866 length:225 start_codon:yes stop_codon:yes gene_type:complete
MAKVIILTKEKTREINEMITYEVKGTINGEVFIVEWVKNPIEQSGSISQIKVGYEFLESIDNAMKEVITEIKKI